MLRLVLLQATEAGDLVTGLPNFGQPSTALAPINSAFYSILTGTGQHLLSEPRKLCSKCNCQEACGGSSTTDGLEWICYILHITG